jgi:hypothetical protein
MITATRSIDTRTLINNQQRWFFESLGFYPKIHARFPNPMDSHHSKTNCTFILTKEGVILFKDFRLDKCWNAWQLKTLLGNLYTSVGPLPKLEVKKSKPLKCTYRQNPDQEYFNYFMAAGVDIKVEDNVKQVSRIFFGQEKYRPNDLTICYIFDSDKTKVYRPFNKQKKWLSNTSKQDIWNFEPDKLSYVLTSSMKDALVLKHNLGVNAIAPQSESSIPKELLEHLRNKDVYVLFDSDDVGLEKMRELNRNYGFKTIVLSEKDPYDLCLSKGTEALKTEYYDQINNGSKLDNGTSFRESCPF